MATTTIVIRDLDGLIYSALTGDEKRALTSGVACAICGASETDPPSMFPRKIVVDHDHDTDMVRGILWHMTPCPGT